jgi:hypothetical protein
MSKLPIVSIKGKKYYLDQRLKQIRNINNPHDYKDLTDKELTKLQNTFLGDIMHES